MNAKEYRLKGLAAEAEVKRLTDEVARLETELVARESDAEYAYDEGYADGYDEGFTDGTDGESSLIEEATKPEDTE